MADFQKLVEDQEVDYFDNLPDPIVLVIFNKILDAKTLCRCLVVSKRFSLLVPQVDSISIEMNPTKKQKEPIKDSAILGTGSRSKSNLLIKNLIPKFIFKPFQLMGQMLLGKKSGNSSNESVVVDVFKWVGTALKNFNEVESIKLELPCYGGEIGVNKNIPLLKWEAGFGKELQRCVLLGAKSIVKRKEVVIKKGGEGGQEINGENESENENEPLFSDEELKLRIIWIISCLIASSSRHNLLKKMVGDCPKLSNAVISDAGKQGMLCMDAGQIKELRDSMKNNSAQESESVSVSESESESSDVVGAQMGHAGNLVMKLWYVKELELPSSGYVMKGATLVVIRPDGKVEKEKEKEKEKEGDVLNLEGVFDGDEVFGEAAKELLKRKQKRLYRLEMNSI